MRSLMIPLIRSWAGLLMPGAAQVKWWDTRTGRVLQVDQLTAGVNGLRLAAPIFSRDIACQVSR